ncbi:MAG: ribonuclease III [Anaerolineae bacterium]
MNLAELETSLGLVFEDKSLLQRALTHRSFLNENPNLPWLDNERLEFLGDSILGFVTAEYLYHHFPEMKEGDLTSLRAALVRGETLAEYAQNMGLGPHLMVSHGEEAAGGRTRRALLAGTFEAIVGAIYLDQGLEGARRIIWRIIEPKTIEIVHERLDRNAKSLLQELSQGQLKVTPTYRTVQTRGPDHAREFTVEVVLGEKVYGIGHGRNKQTAEQQAAQTALQELERQVQQELARARRDSDAPTASEPSATDFKPAATAEPSITTDEGSNEDTGGLSPDLDRSPATASTQDTEPPILPHE